MATMLVDTHLNDPEQFTSLLLPLTVGLFYHLSLLFCQMRVVSVSVTDPAMYLRRHEFIMHLRRRSRYRTSTVQPSVSQRNGRYSRTSQSVVAAEYRSHSARLTAICCATRSDPSASTSSRSDSRTSSA